MSLAEKMLKDQTKKNNKTTTENGDKAFKSTLNANVDLFGSGGSMRSSSEQEITKLIAKAIDEDPKTAIKNILYLSDIREGQGERRFFEVAINYLYTDYPKILEELIPLIPEYGRWDYLYWIIEKDQFSKLSKTCLRLISKEWKDHIETGDSLMFKWLKSLNSSSKRTRELGATTRRYLKLEREEYNTLLSNARTKLDIIEKKMSNQEWSKIDYSKIPSKAGLIYRKAFSRHDAERYSAYLESVKNGGVKINTSVLTPVDILQKYKFHGCSELYNIEETLEVAWTNLPNYLKDSEETILPMIDVSSSMWDSSYGKIPPIVASVALGIYFSQRCNSEYRNKFLTFSETPKFEKLTGNSLMSIINNVNDSDWGRSTDILSAFQLILDTAIKYDLKQKDLPSKFLILSDMQFDDSGSSNKTSVQVAKKRFKDAGYKMPELIFWNLNAKYGNNPVKYDTNGACLISGYNPIILKFLIEGVLETPLETMNKVLNTERYEIVNTFKSLKNIKRSKNSDSQWWY